MIVTAISSTANLAVGMAVSGTGIPTYTTITGILSATSISISLNATVSSAESLTFTNNITIPYTVPISGQVINVKFDRPDLIPIGVEITISVLVPIQDFIATITQAVLNYASGFVSGLPGFAVGRSVSPFEISAAVGIQYPGVYVSNCLVSTIAADTYQAVTLDFDPWELATLTQSNITVSLA